MSLLLARCKEYAFFLAKALSLPLIIYGIFFVIRIRGMQPPSESAMGDFITAIYFMFGASISYLVYVSYCTNLMASSPGNKFWWWCMSSFLLLLAFDEIYMVHENLSRLLNIKDLFIFGVYGVFLCILLFMKRRNMIRASLLFFLLFVVLGAVAVIADALFQAAMINILGREIDYEQLTESLGALSLSCAIVPVALNDLRSSLLIERESFMS